MPSKPKPPISEFQDDGKASVINYNVPEPTTYSGRHYIELIFDDLTGNIFKPVAYEGFQDDELTDADQDTLPLLIRSRLTKEMLKHQRIHPIGIPFPGLTTQAPAPKTMANLHVLPSFSSTNPLPGLEIFDPSQIQDHLKKGGRVITYKNMHGSNRYRLLPPRPKDSKPRPRILLVEIYRLTTYLGDYGAGRTIKTFSLLPGEKTQISIKTYKRTTEESAKASSILDSFSEQSSDEFEDSVQKEQSDKQQNSENFAYHAEAEAECSWGIGSAKVSGGVSGGSSSSREEFVKNVSSATTKHATAASSKRDVQINESSSVKVEEGEETSIIRTIENINLSRTLNFVFRQMNQQYFTFLHLVDVRVAFFNDDPEKKREVALCDLDTLLESYIDQKYWIQVRERIIKQLENILDYTGSPAKDFILARKTPDKKNNYFIINTRYETAWMDYLIPGVVMSVQKNVMRTDAVIVEALLGRGEALDDYSKETQNEAVRAVSLKNDSLHGAVERENQAQKIVTEENEKASKIFERVFPPAQVFPCSNEEENDGD